MVKNVLKLSPSTVPIKTTYSPFNTEWKNDGIFEDERMKGRVKRKTRDGRIKRGMMKKDGEE